MYLMRNWDRTSLKTDRKSEAISRDLSDSALIAGLIGTLLVVALHYKSNRVLPWNQMNRLNFLVQEFFCVGLASSAVPLFAFFSGFFVCKSWKGHSHQAFFLSKVKTLLVPYILASGLIYALTWCVCLLIPSQDMAFEGIAVEFAKTFIKPRSVQFWYLRDLIVITALSPVLFFMKNQWFRYGITGVAAVLWLFEIQAAPIVAGWYLLNIEVVFFFLVGVVIYDNRELLESVIRLPRFWRFIGVILWILLIAARISVQPDIDLWYQNNSTTISLFIHKAGILAGVPVIIQISSMLKNRENLLRLAALTFFVYLFHFNPLFLILSELDGFMDLQWVFYVKYPLVLILTFGTAGLLSNIAPGVYAVLTGNRTNKRRLSWSR